MVDIDRRAWLVFDIVGLVFVIVGTMLYIGLVFHTSTSLGMSIFLMGAFFTILGAIFGYLEGISVSEEIWDIVSDAKAKESLSDVPDDSDVPYIIDMESLCTMPLPDDLDIDSILDEVNSEER